MKISVTADHIARGTRTACQHCPVALAYTEATGHACMVYQFHIRDLATQKIYSYGMALWGRIARFDEDGGMEPFSFEI